MWLTLTDDSGAVLNRWWIDPREMDQEDVVRNVEDHCGAWDSKEQAEEAIG